jgi:hypothetical protein
MRVRTATIAIAVMFGCGLSSNVSADPLTLATPGVVGAYDGGTGTPPPELTIAQAILDLTLIGQISPAGCISNPPGTQCYMNRTAGVDYSGSLGTGIKVDPPGDGSVDLQYEYAIGKYDGHNAGYILFYLPAFGYELPMKSGTVWTSNNGEGHGLSHFTTFNALVVPDGGSTAALLGSVLFAFGVLRRRFGQN